MSLSSSSTPHGTLKTSFPPPAYSSSAGFMPSMSSTAGKVDLIPTAAAGSGAGHLSQDLSDLFKPASTMSDSSVMFGGRKSPPCHVHFTVLSFILFLPDVERSSMTSEIFWIMFSTFI